MKPGWDIFGHSNCSMNIWLCYIVIPESKCKFSLASISYRHVNMSWLADKQLVELMCWLMWSTNCVCTCTTYCWSSAFLFSSSEILSSCSTTSLICGSWCSFGLPPSCSVETCWPGSSVLRRSITYLHRENSLWYFFLNFEHNHNVLSQRINLIRLTTL